MKVKVSIPKLLVLAIFLLLAEAPGRGQTEVTQIAAAGLQGKVRLVTASREFLIRDGRPVAPHTLIAYQREFDTDGRLIRDSTYGNLEQRHIFSYKDGVRKVEIQYFDLKGQPIHNKASSFVSNIDYPITSDLCTLYSTKVESDPIALITNLTETCSSGATRSTRITEENSNGTFRREFIEDAMGRTYERVSIYETPRVLREFRYIANNLKSPKYSWFQTYVNHKFDTVGNVIEMVGSGIHSSKPNQVMIQFVDKFEIDYYP
ncbi:MAG: hypothetical protein AB7Q37_15655 [Pyrinomonadaceae bacterium]